MGTNEAIEKIQALLGPLLVDQQSGEPLFADDAGLALAWKIFNAIYYDTTEALMRANLLCELRWAPHQEFGIPDRAVETEEPPPHSILVSSIGHTQNEIIVYWSDGRPTAG